MRMTQNLHKGNLIADIVSQSLKQEALSGIVDILRMIAEAVDAYGCILWEVAPWANLNSDPPSGKLFEVADWFRNNAQLPLHYLNVGNSAAGLAILKGEIQNVESFKDDPRVYSHKPSIEEHRLTSMCAVPLFSENNESRKSLNVYRNEQIRPFSKDEEDLIKQLADLISPLYRAIRDRVGRKLLLETNEILDYTEEQANVSDAPDQEVKMGLDKLCQRVSDTFQCKETSIFLENTLKSEKIFELCATTWQKWKGKTSYKPQKEEGLTGWVLSERKPVLIPNLYSFEKDKDKLQIHYKGIEWQDSLGIKFSAHEFLDLPKGSDPPPLSFMAVPIQRGDKLLGVIRCCMATSPPWLFVDRQYQLLELVAASVSRFWDNWLKHLEENEENRSWTTLVKQLSQLNHNVKEELNASALKENRLYKDILSLAQKVIRGADVLDIRLRDEERNELYFASTMGKGWDKARQNKRFTVITPPPPDSLLGLKVLDTGDAICVMNAEESKYRSTTFPDTKRIVIAPIGVQRKTVGLLDVRGTGNRPFSSQALFMAKLLGQQLGLYLSLAENERQQRQVFEDLWHQSKGPVLHFYARIQNLVQEFQRLQWHLSDSDRASELENKLLMIRGVARKAKRVIINAGRLGELVSEGRLNLSKNNVQMINQDTVVKMLIEASADTEMTLEDYRRIRIHVERDTLKGLSKNPIRVDVDLFEQAISCLLDNAGKYSYNNTRVSIYGGEENQDGARFFYIAVKNSGLAISEEEAERCKDRNYRGAQARQTTGEGSGIGLWVTDHIMQAHKGELRITPTIDGWTEVRLCFPITT